jgi:hypothetical protein
MFHYFETVIPTHTFKYIQRMEDDERRPKAAEEQSCLGVVIQVENEMVGRI